MVNYSSARLDRVFGALADCNRRAILDRVSRERSLTISQVAKPLPIKLPAVMKHIRVLSDAGLIRRRKVGRSVTIWLAPDAMRVASAWLARHEEFWSPRLDKLTRYAEGRERAARKEKA